MFKEAGIALALDNQKRLFRFVMSQVEEEREECALIALGVSRDSFFALDDSVAGEIADDRARAIAQAIRERG